MRLCVPDGEVAALEARLAASTGPGSTGAARRDTAVELAWHLRERDPARAAQLAQEALRGSPPPTGVQQGRAALVLGHVALLKSRLEAASERADYVFD